MTSSPISAAYPVGTPGQAWGASEVAQWRVRQTRHRRYAEDVLDALDRLRERFLTELTLDPPEATSDESGPPHQDEDYLILSTIHSAKGQEWNCLLYTSPSPRD